MAKVELRKKLKKAVSEWLNQHYEPNQEVAQHYTEPLKAWLAAEHQIERYQGNGRRIKVMVQDYIWRQKTKKGQGRK